MGKVKEKEADYDLLTAVMICLDSGKEEKEGNHQEGTEESEILRLLEVLFSTEKELKEKEKIVVIEYGITMTYEEKEEVEKMCYLSEYVREKGIREGREEGLRTGINYGELQNLVRMVLKKMRKDVSYKITAELFEEPVEKIRKIYDVAEKYAPEYDIESICRELAAYSAVATPQGNVHVPYRWILYSIRCYSVKEAHDERDRRIQINKE